MKNEREKKTVFTIRKILFVSKNKNNCVSHFSVVDNPMQLLTSFLDSISICTVDYKNESLGPSVIVTPKWANFVLPTNILKRKNQCVNKFNFRKFKFRSCLILFRSKVVKWCSYPDIEFDIFISDCFHVESYCRNRGDRLS